MKFLHSSDWHIGQTLYSYDRSEEHAAMMRQMVEMVRGEQPDVFLLCGDLFHSSQPSASSQKLLTDAIAELHRAAPEMAIVLTAGNHDSAARHDVFRAPWQLLNVHTFGALNSADPESHILEIPGKGWVVAVPYVHERNLPEGIWQRLLDAVAERNVDGLPVIMMAHTTVSGCDFAGHDRASERNVGGIDSVTLEEMGSGYDYLALGHIHRGQWIRGGHHRVRYSGTPLPVSFDETYPHSVTIVEIDAHGDEPRTREVEMEVPIPLVTLPAEGWLSWEEALQALSDFPADTEAYIRLNVEVTDYLPSHAYDDAKRLTMEKRCRFCMINVRRDAQHAQSDSSHGISIDQLREMAPLSIAEQYADDKGWDFDDELHALFREALFQVEEDARHERNTAKSKTANKK